jgi:4-oxalocrotonate tautomerase
MPYVNVKVTKDVVTKEQNEEIIRGVTNLIKDILGKILKPQLP